VSSLSAIIRKHWIPAFAGMTGYRNFCFFYGNIKSVQLINPPPPFGKGGLGGFQAAMTQENPPLIPLFKRGKGPLSLLRGEALQRLMNIYPFMKNGVPESGVFEKQGAGRNWAKLG